MTPADLLRNRLHLIQSNASIKRAVLETAVDPRLRSTLSADIEQAEDEAEAYAAALSKLEGAV